MQNKHFQKVAGNIFSGFVFFIFMSALTMAADSEPFPGYFAYNSMERVVPTSYDEGYAGGIWTNPCNNPLPALSSTRAAFGSKSLRLNNPYQCPNHSYRLTLTTDLSGTGLFDKDFYESRWNFLETQYNLDHKWWQFWEVRETLSQNGGACGGVYGSHVSIYLMGSAPNLYWWFVKGHQPGGATPPVRFSWKVDGTSAWRDGYDPRNYPDSYVVANPHEVPWNRWFKLDIYLHRDSNNKGIFKVWITDPEKNVKDKLLFSIENVGTSCTAGYSAYDGGTQPMIIKQYGWSGVAYYDDLYLYNFNPRAGPDITPPTVSSTDPANNAINVAPSKTIRVTCNENIQPGTASGSITLKDQANAVIVTTNSISGNTLTIDPVSDLGYTTVYTLTIPANAVKDMSGNNLANQYSFSFTTSAQPVLTSIAVSSSPAFVLKNYTQQFTAFPKDQFGNLYPTTVIWTSSSTTVGIVTSAGLFTALNYGSTIITAASGSVSGTSLATVTDQTPGLVGHWKFDDATASDSSGNGNNGTVNGATATTGKIGNALQFDGVNDYVNIPDSNSLDATTLTFMTWIKNSKQDALIAYDRIASKKVNWDDVNGWGIYLDNFGSIRVIGSGSARSSVNVLPTGWNNAWHHLAVVMSGVQASVYLDGSLKGTSAIDSLAPNTIDLSIARFPAEGRYFNGTIDELKIYNRAMSGSEILAEYNAGNIPSDTTLPSIAITLPTDGQVLTTANITVSGTASDNISVSKVEVKVGTGTWQTASGTTSWSWPVTLSQGANTIYARATDTAGNTKETSIAVMYNSVPSPDTTPPSVTIISPVDGQALNTAAITVNGTAADNAGVSKVEVKVGAGIWNTASGTTSWSVPVILVQGTNTIYARATDTSGNIKDVTITVTCDTGAAPDNEPPTVTIAYPRDGQIFNTSTITINGTAADNVGVSRIEIDVEPSGNWVTLSGVSNWSMEIILIEGVNIINVIATDSSGNGKIASISVTYNAMADVTPPQISNIQITNNNKTSSIISWQTDEPATVLVKYGMQSGNYVNQLLDTNLGTTHSINLTGLQPETTYYFVVVAMDASGNAVQSNEYSFVAGKSAITLATDSKIKAYPNPYIKGRSVGQEINFANLPNEAKLKIYDSSGKLVKELSAESNGIAKWDVSNVSSGIYLYIVTSPEGVKKGKVSVIK